MSKVTIKAGEVNTISTKGDDGSPLFTTAKNQVAARDGTGTLTFKARAAGSKVFTDILDGSGSTIGELNFAAPVIFTVEASINALQCDATGLSSNAVIEIVSL